MSPAAETRSAARCTPRKRDTKVLPEARPCHPLRLFWFVLAGELNHLRGEVRDQREVHPHRNVRKVNVDRVDHLLGRGKFLVDRQATSDCLRDAAGVSGKTPDIPKPIEP